MELKVNPGQSKSIKANSEKFDIDVTEINLDDSEINSKGSKSVKIKSDPKEIERLTNILGLASNKSIKEINNILDSKIKALAGLVSREGAIYIVANDLGVRLIEEAF